LYCYFSGTAFIILGNFIFLFVKSLFLVELGTLRTRFFLADEFLLKVFLPRLLLRIAYGELETFPVVLILGVNLSLSITNPPRFI